MILLFWLALAAKLEAHHKIAESTLSLEAVRDETS